MAQKKSSNWYIAATHYLTAGFAIPFVVGLVVALLARMGLFTFLSTQLASVIFSLVISVLSIWLGTMYSANYLKKAYIIENKNKIVNLATLYFVVLHFGYFLFQIFRSNKLTSYSLIGIIITAALFYIFSKKYIKNTEIAVK